MRTVRKIEVTAPIAPTRKKVAAYARVSEEKGRTMHSLAAQISFYSDFIQKHGEWEYVGVYADGGISGTTDNRDEFKRLLADCDAGKIDIILTNIKTRYLIQSHFWVQSSKSLVIRGLRGFSFLGV